MKRRDAKAQRTMPEIEPDPRRERRGVASVEWYAGRTSCVRSEPYIEDEVITPLQGFCISSRAIFPGRCFGLQYCALSGLKIAIRSPCKGRLNKAQGNALRKGHRSTMMSPADGGARYVRHDSKDWSRQLGEPGVFAPFPKGSWRRRRYSRKGSAQGQFRHSNAAAPERR
jgi:hypothetical protein